MRNENKCLFVFMCQSTKTEWNVKPWWWKEKVTDPIWQVDKCVHENWRTVEKIGGRIKGLSHCVSVWEHAYCWAHSVCVCVYLCVCVCVMPAYRFVCVYIRVWLVQIACVNACAFVCLPVSLRICMSLCVYVGGGVSRLMQTLSPCFPVPMPPCPGMWLRYTRPRHSLLWHLPGSLLWHFHHVRSILIRPRVTST